MRLKEELEKSKLLADSVNQIDPELLARIEEEKSAIHSEYEQERIAYQKLLKDFNMLEASNDDLKEKLNMLRGDKHDRTISSVSLSSNMQEEDYMSLESAYGGSSGVSGTSTNNNDVGLMMKLQAALKEVHREKDQLEKKLEEMETGNGDRQSLDTLKIQDLEVDNNKLREEMKKFGNQSQNLQMWIIMRPSEKWQNNMKHYRKNMTVQRLNVFNFELCWQMSNWLEMIRTR